MANRKLGGNVQKLGVCCPILSLHTIRTVHGQTNRHGQVIPAISPTSIIHGQNKKIRERHAGETPASNNKNILNHNLSISLNQSNQINNNLNSITLKKKSSTSNNFFTSNKYWV